MFKSFRALQIAHVATMFTGNPTIFLTDVSKEQLWDTYLNSFPEENGVRKSFDCNCCKSFIRQYGNMVTIRASGQLESIWDFIHGMDEYNAVTTNMHKLVVSSPIRDVFIPEFLKLGTDTNFQLGTGTEPNRTVFANPIQRYHFFLELDKSYKNNTSKSIEAVMGELRDSKNVFKRSLDELSINATETLLELIAQNSVYRGAESEDTLKKFLKYQKEYAAITTDSEKDNYCWNKAKLNFRIRNTAVGTLLVDISEGVELTQAVTKFEKIMAPANYKRPNAIYTPSMLKDFEKTANEEGFMSAFERRFAGISDVPVNEVLFVDRTVVASGLLATLASDITVNPKQFNRAESVSLDKFLADILPNSTKVEFLLENKHENNLFSLIAPVHPDALNIFRWNNSFSWSYNNALADSAMKERVKAAGGNVEGILRCSLGWFNSDDLDLHMYEPSNEHIYYGNKHSYYTGATLDVDMNAGGRMNAIDPVENIIYPMNARMKNGIYKLVVNQFSNRNNDKVGFNVEIEFGGETHTLSYNKKVVGSITVAHIEYKDGVFTLEPSADVSINSNIVSRDIWNLKTNTFVKVNSIMFSPNYWEENKIGNKHVFFSLEGARNEGAVRGFYNEFLDPKFDKHKRIFEALGSKAKVQDTPNQVSGVGFSTTSKNEFTVRVTGKTTRTIKVTL